MELYRILNYTNDIVVRWTQGLCLHLTINGFVLEAEYPVFQPSFIPIDIYNFKALDKATTPNDEQLLPNR